MLLLVPFRVGTLDPEAGWVNPVCPLCVRFCRFVILGCIGSAESILLCVRGRIRRRQFYHTLIILPISSCHSYTYFASNLLRMCSPITC